jgi:type IV secretory pathway VirB2 component (pilin)
MRNKFTLALILVCGVAGSLAATSTVALAAAQSKPIQDCSSTGNLSHHYSAAVLRRALATMPADVKEYTDCYDVINRALAADIGGLKGSGTGSSGGSFLPTPVIVVLIVLLLAAATFGAIALRRRRNQGPGDGPPPPAV